MLIFFPARGRRNTASREEVFADPKTQLHQDAVSPARRAADVASIKARLAKKKAPESGLANDRCERERRAAALFFFADWIDRNSRVAGQATSSTGAMHAPRPQPESLATRFKAVHISQAL